MHWIFGYEIAHLPGGQVKRIFFLCAMVAMAAVSCNEYRLKVASDASDKDADILPLRANVDWQLISTKVLFQCKDCHSGQQKLVLSGIETFRQNINSVWEAVSKGAMPPRKPPYSRLMSCRLAALKAWIEDGAPETATRLVGDLPECRERQPRPPILDMPLNYQTLKSEILDPVCWRCHNADSESSAKSILFDPYSELMSDPVQRWSSPAAQSKIIRSVTRNDKHRMPPPTEGDALTSDEIEFIVRWIDAGKPEH
jgi:hypothetical protein